MKYRHKLISIVFLCVCGSPTGAQQTAVSTKSVRGWLTDEQCASARAKAGLFTATNPDCAKRCVAEGKRVVLVDPEAKHILQINNQPSLKDYIGDYVELIVKVDPKTGSLDVVEVTTISKGSAQCVRPKSGK